jgi:flagellar protein FlaI
MAEQKKQSASNEREGVIDSYVYDNEGIQVLAKIIAKKGEYTPLYEVNVRELSEGTWLVLNKLKGELITTVKLDITEIMDPKKREDVKAKFEQRATDLLARNFPALSEADRKVLSSYLIQNSLGLGELEPLMHDDTLEEVAINSASDPVWVYHKKYGWCKTNVFLKSEESIYDIAAMIGRRIGKQINVLSPVMDAHLSSGDRVNATLYPVSSFGNTITIRKFSRNPWTVPYLIELNCISPQVAGLIWLCIQNELSLIVSGGTGSGKTSFLNAISCLIPANQRVISIEDTRELTLPKFLQWIPMVTREPNAEGKGEITMLDLLVNSLRQRPDRIIMGEVRKQREAEILFEAMHTGHSVYATIHADNAQETITRLTTPPISMPKETISSLAAIVVQFRHRRLNIRRTLEFAEVQKGGDINTLHRWDLKNDRLNEVGKMMALSTTLSLYAGLTQKEIDQDVADKAKIFGWMIKRGYKSVDTVGEIVSDYYMNPDEVVAMAAKNSEWSPGK